MKKIFIGIGLLLAVDTAMSQIKIGEAMPEISLPAPNDSIVNLSSFKGKVVLIDFWASWCRPCRASNPFVQRLYKKYKLKGFEVFAVSSDKKKEAWVEAIKQDKITYTQVNDNSGWDSKVLQAFGVEEIPTTFLLDKNGKLVAIDAEGRKLESLVKALVK